uniref:Uncharacterized protein n=1 Tax=Megaselia scalaris TaxID=36166 RepID=T1H139_MEGSC
MRASNSLTSNTIHENKSTHILEYADDIDVIGRTRLDVESIFVEIGKRSELRKTYTSPNYNLATCNVGSVQKSSKLHFCLGERAHNKNKRLLLQRIVLPTQSIQNQSTLLVQNSVTEHSFSSRFGPPK